MLFTEDGRKSFLPHQRYQRAFLKSCSAMVIVCIVCYAYVQLDGTDRRLHNFGRWNFREVLQKTLHKIGTPETKRERKRILLWTPYFSAVDWLPSTQELQCAVKECDVSSNRSLVVNSSAIILHWRNINPDNLPSFLESNAKPSSDTPLVAVFNKEAPPNTPKEIIEKMNNKIHLTITYRRDSDVHAPYGWIERRNDTFTIPKFNASKTNVCWLVSNCHTSSAREEYVNDLKNYIDVDIYGTCGDKRCPHEHAKDCYRMLSERCKFYLSFENSICKDYVTEKFFYALMFDMVPVVLGGTDYARYFPPHSFIDVADFSNPKSLAKYLLETARNEASYLSYFKWKETYKAEFVPYFWLCELCEMLHSPVIDKLKPHSDMISWWYKESNCGSLKED